MTQDIRLSIDVEGIESLIEKNTDLEAELAIAHKQLATRDDNKLFTACLAVGSVLVNLALIYYIALHAVTVHGLFKAVTR